MAAIRSLGLHRPTGLSWFIEQGRLDATAKENEDFQWKTYTVSDGVVGQFEEELVFTPKCVVWSRGPFVQRAFPFWDEKEDIRDALFARFKKGGRGRILDEKLPEHPPMAGGMPPPKDKAREKMVNGVLDELKKSEEKPLDPTLDNSRAIIVILKTQAHVFFLKGGDHIVPLPFEVESAWPTPNGVLFQRKIKEPRPSRDQKPDFRSSTRSLGMSTSSNAQPTSETDLIR
ncbi:Anaphase-promoting complex subunit 1, partial [Ascosphaera atra]